MIDKKDFKGARNILNTIQNDKKYKDKYAA
jgi:hypothetical protein